MSQCSAIGKGIEDKVKGKDQGYNWAYRGKNCDRKNLHAYENYFISQSAVHLYSYMQVVQKSLWLIRPYVPARGHVILVIFLLYH